MVGLTFNQAGNGMFVWERLGKVWGMESGQRQLLLDISEEVGAWHDHGLRGFALHPQFDANGYIYLLYLVDRHYLMNFGTAAYNPAANDYYSATIGRLTRYQVTRTGGAYAVVPGSRTILLGATKITGVPSTERSHVTGSLVFGTDGTLLVSTGDGGTGADTDFGSSAGTYYAQVLADGIIQPRENVGAFRAQLVDCLSGRILRLDPMTGAGVPSNPFYNAANPNAPRSKVWALDFRNPFRMSLKPGTGSPNPAAANPGALYVGDVGYITWEEVSVVDRPRQNMGWSLYEGLTPHDPFIAHLTANQDAPNPLSNVNGCTQQYFNFQDLFKQATPTGTATFANPCNPAQAIPASIPTFVQTRPLLDWQHGAGPSRTGTLSGGTASTADLGAAGAPVSGPQFGGSAAVGGVFYPFADFPAGYQNSYFFGDYVGGWIRSLTVDASNQPTAVRNFVGTGAVVVGLASQLSYAWQTFLHHQTHVHPEPVDTARQTSTSIDPHRPAGLRDRDLLLPRRANRDGRRRPVDQAGGAPKSGLRHGSDLYFLPGHQPQRAGPHPRRQRLGRGRGPQLHHRRHRLRQQRRAPAAGHRRAPHGHDSVLRLPRRQPEPGPDGRARRHLPGLRLGRQLRPDLLPGPQRPNRAGQLRQRPGRHLGQARPVHRHAGRRRHPATHHLRRRRQLLRRRALAAEYGRRGSAGCYRATITYYQPARPGISQSFA